MTVPELDDELRQRLVARYGADVESWLDALPPVVDALAARWHLELDSLIPRGHMSVVIRCRTPSRPAVLKLCPDVRRLADEVTALRRWNTPHVAEVLDADVDVGALLLEAVEPGTMFLDLSEFPAADVASLLADLHTTGQVAPSYPAVADRVEYLFDAWARHRARQPELLDVVSQDVFDHGRSLAMQLAAEPSSTVLLHGDLTPVNVLDGGRRGLVAIDPAPCVGDPAFDAVDLLFWRAADVDTITARANAIARAADADAERLVAWCGAFAGMVASELAADGADRTLVECALALARAV